MLNQCASQIVAFTVKSDWQARGIVHLKSCTEAEDNAYLHTSWSLQEPHSEKLLHLEIVLVEHWRVYTLLLITLLSQTNLSLKALTLL